MASFADFARATVERQVAYYERLRGEYNQDPFSLLSREKMTVQRIFGLASDRDQNSSESADTSLKLDALAVEYQNLLASKETRQRKLFQEHRDVLVLKEHELAELRSAQDPVLTALSKEISTKNALVEYRRYGFDRLRYVCNAGVLAVVDEATRSWFYPRNLPMLPVRLDPSMFCPEDAMGSIEKDTEAIRRSSIPRDMSILSEKFPFWYTCLHDFHLGDVLKHTPWVHLRDQVETLSVPDPARELVYAMVVTRQIASFFGRGEGCYPSSYGPVDRLHDAFYRHVKIHFVDPALEALYRKFQTVDWSSLCVSALKHLPIFLPCNGCEETDDAECLFTGRTRDLFRVTVVRCPVLEWNYEGSFPEHVASFKNRYDRGRQRWWDTTVHRSCDRSKRRRRLTSCSSTSSDSSLWLEDNSRMRGRTSRSRCAWNNNEEDAFDGFLVGPWNERLFLHEEIFELLVHAWRLSHLDRWIDYTFLEFKESKRLFNSTNEELIRTVAELVVTALQKCQALNESQ